jgi:hypothetical protein
MMISVTEGGKAYLKIAGYHMGETRWVGERRRIVDTSRTRSREFEKCFIADD